MIINWKCPADIIVDFDTGAADLFFLQSEDLSMKDERIIKITNLGLSLAHTTNKQNNQK